MLRRLKEDDEKTIPVKEETIIEVEMTSVQRAYYRAILERNFSFLRQVTSHFYYWVETDVRVRKRQMCPI
jgi:SNF2 family DNA or RNA helicase